MADLITPALLVSEYLAYKNKTSTAADVRVQWEADIEEATAAIQAVGFCNRRFDERMETRYYTPLQRRNGGNLQGVSLSLNDDLLSPTQVLNGNGVDITAAVVMEPLNSFPKHTLWLDPDMAQWSAPAGATPVKGSVSVTGVWGYGNGRWAALTTLAGNVDANTTTFAVATGTGDRYEAGMFLTLEDEYVLVIEVTEDNLTVVRGHNGSTAAAHNGGTVIYRYHFDPRITRVMKRFLDWILAQKSSPFVGTAKVGDFEIPVDMTEIPKDLQRHFGALQRNSARLRVIGSSS